MNLTITTSRNRVATRKRLDEGEKWDVLARALGSISGHPRVIAVIDKMMRRGSCGEKHCCQ